MTSRDVTSLQHPLVKHFVKVRTDKAYRDQCQTVILEGLKVIQELSSEVLKVFYTSEYASFIPSCAGEKFLVTEAILNKISGMRSPEGIVAEVQMPTFSQLDVAKKVLALDGMSDPGNMGTLLRTALALGWDTLFFLPGTCDPFNEKVLRSARGAHFKLNLVKGTGEELRDWVKKNKIQSWVADLKGIAPEEISPASKRLLVLGNEAHGPSEVIHQFCQSVTIQMTGEMESLNVAVAGAILLYLLK